MRGDVESESSRFQRLRGWAKVRDKSLWDWMELLIVPIVLGAGVAGFGLLQSERAEVRAEQRALVDHQLALDRDREAALQGYFDSMAELLLNNNLKDSGVADSVRDVARLRTIAALNRIDDSRKLDLARFLVESGLNAAEDGEDPIVDLTDADFSGIDVRGREFDRLELSHLTLAGGKFTDSTIVNARMVCTSLSGADLTRASAAGINLSGAILFDTTATDADLRNAELIGADLRDADLSRARLDGADLTGAFFSNSTLLGADVTNRQLARAVLIDQTVMPDGSIMNRAGWAAFQKEHGVKLSEDERAGFPCR